MAQIASEWKSMIMPQVIASTHFCLILERPAATMVVLPGARRAA